MLGKEGSRDLGGKHSSSATIMKWWSKGLLNANRPFSTHVTCCLLVPSSGVAPHDRVEEADLVSELPLTDSRKGLCPATMLVGTKGWGKRQKEKYSKPCLVEILYFCNIVQCL